MTISILEVLWTETLYIIRTFAEALWWGFRLIFPTKEKKARRKQSRIYKERKPQVEMIFKDLYKRHREMSPGEIIEVLENIHSLYPLPLGYREALQDIMEFVYKNSDRLDEKYIPRLSDMFFWEEVWRILWSGSIRPQILSTLEKFPIKKDILQRFRDYLQKSRDKKIVPYEQIWIMGYPMKPSRERYFYNLDLEIEALEEFIRTCEKNSADSSQFYYMEARSISFSRL